MFGLGIGEILVILVIALIFIGPKKLPELAKNLGKGMREFQNAMRGINNSIDFRETLHNSSPEFKPGEAVSQNQESEQNADSDKSSTSTEKSNSTPS